MSTWRDSMAEARAPKAVPISRFAERDSAAPDGCGGRLIRQRWRCLRMLKSCRQLVLRTAVVKTRTAAEGADGGDGRQGWQKIMLF